MTARALPMPPHIDILAGPCRPAKSDHLLGLCVERIQQGREDSFILIVPSPQRAEQANERLLAATQHGFFKPFVGTFNELIQALYQMVGGGGAPVSTAVKAVLVQEILSSDPGRFPYLNRQQREEPFRGLVARLCDLISELKRNLIAPEGLPELLGPHRGKGKDLAALYGSYQELLLEHGLVDGEGVFWLLNEELQKPEATDALGQFDLLLLDGIHDLTKAEREVLIHLMRIIDRTVVAIDYWPGSASLGSATRALYEALVEAGGKLTDLGDNVAPSYALHVESNLFAAPSKLKARGGCRDDVQVYRCADRQHEIRALSAQIKGLAQGGIDLTRICLAAPDLRQYTQLVREIFPRFGIPFEISGGLPLAQAPASTAAMSVLRVVASGYQRQDVINCLRSPYVRFVPEHAAEALDADEVDWLSREAGVIKGRHDWQRMLVRHVEALKRQIAAAEAGQSNEEERGDTQARLRMLHGQLGSAERLLPAIDDFLTLLSGLEGQHRPDAFRDRFAEILGRLEFQQQIVAGYRLGLSAADLRRDTVALDRFWRCVDSVVFSVGFSDREHHSLVQFHDLLASALAETTYRPERRSTGVKVVSVRDTRALAMDYLFLAGLVEREFPRLRTQDIFLPEALQRKIGMKTEPHVEDEDRYLFYQCLVRPTAGVRLFWPALVEGTEALRSPFIDELVRISDVQEDEPKPSEQPMTWADLQVQLGRGLSGQAHADEAQTLKEFAGWAGHQPDVADSLVRNLRVRDERANVHRLSSFQGHLSAARDRLSELWPESRPFSISQFETYGRCPFAFFMERVLGLTEPEEPSEDLSALTRGDVMHQILRRYYAERGQRGPVDLGEHDDVDTEKEAIKRIAAEVLDELGREGLFWEAEREAIVGRGEGAGRPGLLNLFIEFEIQDGSLCRPRFFEVAFGELSYAEAVDQELKLPMLSLPRGADPEVALVGKIDRIDVADGTKFLVMDYKTGSSTFGKAETMEGVNFQIPVYIMAVQAGKGRDWQPVGGVYYKIRNPSDFGKTRPLVEKSMRDTYCGSNDDRSRTLSDGELEEILGVSEDWIVQYAHWLRAGKFPPMCHSRNGACMSYCPYRDMCRVDPARMSNERMVEVMSKE